MQRPQKQQHQAAADDKDAKLTALTESNRELIRDVKRLLAVDSGTGTSEDVATSSHHRDVLKTMWLRMRKCHNDQVNYLYEEMEENDRLWRTKVARRDFVIRQLRDAIEKLEVALKTMTEVATQASKAKTKARADVKVLEGKIRLLEVAKGRSDDNMAYAARAAEKNGIDLKARLSSKAAELKMLEDTKEKEFHEVQGAKALLSLQLQAKEKELEKEMNIRDRSTCIEGTADKENADQASGSNAGWSVLQTATTNVSAAAALSYLNHLFDPSTSTEKLSEGSDKTSSSVDKGTYVEATARPHSKDVLRKPLGSVN